MRSLEWILTQYNWCPMEKENLDIEIDTHRGKMMRRDGDRDWNYVATNQGESGATRSWKRPGSILP